MNDKSSFLMKNAKVTIEFEKYNKTVVGTFPDVDMELIIEKEYDMFSSCDSKLFPVSVDVNLSGVVNFDEKGKYSYFTEKEEETELKEENEVEHSAKVSIGQEWSVKDLEAARIKVGAPEHALVVIERNDDRGGYLENTYAIFEWWA